jgi:acetyltransferase-like isoleucine patch superfamily enzyme
MSRLIMGHRSYGSPLLRGDISDVYIGKYCSIAQNVIFDCGWNHEAKFVTTFPLNVFFEQLKHITGHPVSRGDIHVGNDCWIGEGAIIMGGVKVGDGAIVGAGAVVTKDILPYQIVGGVPAKHIRMRFDAEIIAEVLRIKWWDWDEQRISKNGELLMQSDIIKFIKEHK